MHNVSYEYSYRYPPAKEGIFLPVSLKAGNETVTISAAVDTGASFCLFARSVAEALEIEVESGFPQVFASATGRVEAFGHSVQLTILETQVDAVVFFFANSEIHKNLLGRRGWLESNPVRLDEYRQIVYASNAQ